MQQRLSVIVLGVRDMARARAFYEQGLGWKAAPASQEEIVFYQLGGFGIGLYGRDALAEDANLDPAGTGFGGIALAYNVHRREEVDAVIAEAAAAGGKVLKPAHDAFWGGYSGYFADPDGHPWEVAWNPGFALDEEGRLVGL